MEMLFFYSPLKSVDYMDSYNKKQIKMGDYLIFPQHNKLSSNNKEYKIEPKIMQILCYLIDHKNEVVSRAQIAERLWPETITGLKVVTRAIFELRRILKDDPKNPLYIETIARKGYCFIHDISIQSKQINNNDTSIKRTKAYNKVLSIIQFAGDNCKLLSFRE